jgi:hypothetical protein
MIYWKQDIQVALDVAAPVQKKNGMKALAEGE